MLQVPRMRNIGECIYCGSVDGPLQKEHVVPYGLLAYGDGLNEDVILLKASCRDCAVVTSRFEQDVLRSLFQPIRTVLGLRTRNRSARPGKLPIVLKSPVVTWSIGLSPSESPLYLPVIRFPAPGVMGGRLRTPGVQLETIDARHIAGPTFQDLWDVGLRYGAAPFIGGQLTFSLTDFARMLAKIAYGTAVCLLGIRPFKNAEIRRVILGQDPCVGYWVGSPDFRMTQQAGAHAVQIHASGSDLHVFLRLFAQFGPPEYHVVLGPADPDFVNSDEWPFK